MSLTILKKLSFILCFGILLQQFSYAQATVASRDSLRPHKVLSPTDSLQRLVDSQPDTLRHGFFNADKFHSSFHVQFEGDAAFVFSKTSAITGIEVAWVVNHRLSLGARFDILTSSVKINKYINSNDTIRTQTPYTPNIIKPANMSAMIVVGYIIRSGKKVSVEPSLGVGWTSVTFTDPKVGWIDSAEEKFVDATFNYAIVNPSVSVIWNATKYFRVGAVVGARVVFGTDYLRLKSYRVGGVYAGLFFRFGTF